MDCWELNLDVRENLHTLERQHQQSAQQQGQTRMAKGRESTKYLTQNEWVSDMDGLGVLGVCEGEKGKQRTTGKCLRNELYV